MSNILNAVKNGLSGVRDATAKELDRRRRIIGVQSEISDRETDIKKVSLALTKQISGLYRAKTMLFPPDIAVLCDQIITLEDDIRARELEIQGIEKEAVEDVSNQPIVVSPTPAVNAIVSSQVISQSSSTPAIDSSANSGADLTPPLQSVTPAIQNDQLSPVVSTVPPAVTVNKFCAHCGIQLSRPGAKFCTTCGKSQIL